MKRPPMSTAAVLACGFKGGSHTAQVLVLGETVRFLPRAAILNAPSGSGRRHARTAPLEKVEDGVLPEGLRFRRMLELRTTPSC